MANRWFNQFPATLQKKVIHLYAKVTFGASGAPTLSTLNSKGIASITRSSAGKYVITLQDKYLKLLCAKHVFNSGSSAPASPSMYVFADAVSTTPSITFIFNAAGTATDPASGEIVYLELIFGDSDAI